MLYLTPCYLTLNKYIQPLKIIKFKFEQGGERITNQTDLHLRQVFILYGACWIKPIGSLTLGGGGLALDSAAQRFSKELTIKISHCPHPYAELAKLILSSQFPFPSIFVRFLG